MTTPASSVITPFNSAQPHWGNRSMSAVMVRKGLNGPFFHIKTAMIRSDSHQHRRSSLSFLMLLSAGMTATWGGRIDPMDRPPAPRGTNLKSRRRSTYPDEHKAADSV